MDLPLDAQSLNASLSSVVTGLLQDDATQASAVSSLATLVDRAEGETAEAVGKTIRDFGAMAPLLDLLDRTDTQQDALRVIGNLASNAVDQNAEETKRLLHDLDAFPRVLPLIHSEASATVIYALGAVQNLLVRPEYARHMQNVGADVRLRKLLQSGAEDETLQHFANGCLANMKAVLAPGYKAPALTIPSPQQQLAAASQQLSGLSLGSKSRSPAGGRSGGGDRSGELVRLSVPADNNCLFTTCALLCDKVCRGLSPDTDAKQLQTCARGLRRACAQLVAETPDRATTLALLDFADAEEYATWIMDETHWGGEPEVSMLAEHYSVEITVATCDGSRILSYGGGRNRHVVYMLYTGQHYDPLVGPPPTYQRKFPAQSVEPQQCSARENAALQLAEEHEQAAALAAVERSLPAGALPSSPGVGIAKPTNWAT